MSFLFLQAKAMWASKAQRKIGAQAPDLPVSVLTKICMAACNKTPPKNQQTPDLWTKQKPTPSQN
jgi:hypothetical protein